MYIHSPASSYGYAWMILENMLSHNVKACISERIGKRCTAESHICTVVLKALSGAHNKTLRPGGFFGYSGLFPSVIPLLHHHNLIVPSFRRTVKFFRIMNMLCS